MDRENAMKLYLTRTICLIIILVMGVGCGIYLSDYYKADDTALAAMDYQGDDVQIEQDGNIISFSPQEPTAGMIFYPGGKVQCEAYSPLMLACAQRGIFCVLVRMPGNLAVLHPDAADGIPEKYPQIESWYIGGHSLGGCHGYFGCYGKQKGDGQPTITNQEQVEQTAEAISTFIIMK